ncbi:hypothetical protein [Virgibacillus oceani]|uniref:Uncharacterized protein n=1 Tax=Virgibacillus oceani TaxID=1479511 RepID=A0A917M117_9BACI|nr:hypothetical protein [Virgibacillus oceani]GGG72333.1 hypothetical protein GCM10011398_15860 [Virgibacillus oceani]
MPLWAIILILFGGLLLIGIIVDVIAKIRGKKIDLEKKDRHMSESERVYSESFMHEIKKDTQNL